ncbi:MAG: DUF2256 domain-containing protein [Alphaproteobacteria bacterium]
MARSNSKQFLPKKICPVCLRPFSWRLKWKKNWETVKYCSQKCKRNAPFHTPINSDKDHISI